VEANELESRLGRDWASIDRRSFPAIWVESVVAEKKPMARAEKMIRYSMANTDATPAGSPAADE
jgi:hypothetical protein